uniref:CCR4-NOT transcription complex subunit 10 n=1 Tax=Onchocerca volvulus TaxID=6282 RepID=A0A8R1TWL8_ONCVO
MKSATTTCSSSLGGMPLLSSSSLSTSLYSSLSDVSDLSKEAFTKHNFIKCSELLKKTLEETESEAERRRLYANLALCEAKSKAQLFNAEYKTALLNIFPMLKSDGDHNLSDHDEAIAAFNLALNAFVRGNRRTCLVLLQSVMTVHPLSDTLFCSVSLLEIEVSLTLCQPKLALKQATRLRDSTTWRRANVVQRDYLDCLECRIRCRLAQTSSLIDFSSKPELFHWCLIQSEFDMKNGNATRAINRLLKFRPSLQDEDRRLVDNALGCVYALSLKKISLAESYFRSAMLVRQDKRKSWQESTIPRHCLIYHAALAQLHCGHAKSAFTLFLSILPFYPKQPRIWLRIAECCIYTLTKVRFHNVFWHFLKCFCRTYEYEDSQNIYQNGNDNVDTNEQHIEIVGTAQNGYVILPSTSSKRENSNNEVDEVRENEISWEYAAHCIRNALILTGTERDCIYLLPWLYAASSFINLNLGRYGLALKAACQLASLQQVSPHHKFMAVLFKAEALMLLDRLPEAIGCLTQAVPLQSMPSTISAVIYNRALLQALSGNFHKSLTTFGLLGTQCDITTVPEAVSLGVYINMKLDKTDDARCLLVQHMQKMKLS